LLLLDRLGMCMAGCHSMLVDAVLLQGAVLYGNSKCCAQQRLHPGEPRGCQLA
jgi:hypothetical protein